MGNRRVRNAAIAGLAIASAVALLANAAWASTTKVVYSFAGDEDGEYPDTELVMDAGGNLYGTTVLGGDFGSGTVFQLTPSGSGWTHTVLHSFTSGPDGGQPYGGVTLDAQGNLYGTTVTGGIGGCEGGCGVAYRLSRSGSSWTETVVHSFTGGLDGSGPGVGVTLDQHGNLYGMTPTGGRHGLGVIYRIRLAQPGAGSLKVLHAFSGQPDGSTASKGRLIVDGAGHLFGATTVGGANDQGEVFELRRAPAGQWQIKTLYSFAGQPDAGFPYGGLTFDPAGNLYGTTYYDGANDLGSVYQLHRGTGGAWSERVIYSFKGGADGSFSISNVVFDANGNLYGTTSEGGAAACSCGTIFKLTPDAQGHWTESIVHTFSGSPDGSNPYNGLVADAGTLYGTTVHGGVDDEGSVFQFTP